jgi:predicted phage terminase large subunit-like protein
MGLVAYHQLNKAARKELFVFMGLVHRTLSPNVPFIHAKHLRVIAYHLELVERGEVNRLLITLPPRNFKSQAASVAYPAWILGRNPYAKIICASYGNDLALPFSRQTREIMRSLRFRHIFPQAVLDPKTQSIELLQTLKKGYRRTTSVDGAVTGHGADFIIVDDPLKASEAQSEAARNRAHDFVTQSLMSRFDDPAHGKMVLVSQRLHEDDVPGRLLSEGGWTHVNLPGEILEPMSVLIGETEDGTPIELDLEAGACLFPERFGVEALKQLKSDLGEAAYATQILQRPAPAGGLVFKLKWFPNYETQPQGFERIIQSWDTAVVANARADFSACTTWGILGPHVYLLDVFRKRLEFPDLEKAVLEQRVKWKADHVIVEQAFSGLSLLQNLQKVNSPRWLWGIQPSGSKLERAMRHSAFIEKGRVHLPQSAAWLDQFCHEISTFPNSTYDDQVDSMTQFLAALRHGNQGAAVIRDLTFHKYV